MTREEFRMKLYPFFTADQIQQLDDYAYEIAKDAIEGPKELTKEEVHCIGRFYVCEWLAFADLDEIQAIVDGVTQEQLDKLYKQMEDEW